MASRKRTSGFFNSRRFASQILQLCLFSARLPSIPFFFYPDSNCLSLLYMYICTLYLTSGHKYLWVINSDYAIMYLLGDPFTGMPRAVVVLKLVQSTVGVFLKRLRLCVSFWSRILSAVSAWLAVKRYAFSFDLICYCQGGDWRVAKIPI